MNTEQPTALSGIKSLLAANEVKLALEQLISFLRGVDSVELYNEAILHMSQLSRLQKQERLGLLGPGDANTQRARITHSVLQLLDAIPGQLQRQRSSSGAPVKGFTAPAETRLEKIFGISHLRSISWLHHGIEVSRSVCRILTPRDRGTGFLVAGPWLLTNQHVIPDAQVAADTWVEFGYEEDRFQRLTPSHRYRLRPDTLQTDATLDVCLVRLEEDPRHPPLSSWGTLELAPSASPKPGDHVTIIQHPQGGPKQIALTANQVVNLYEHWLQYSTDTLPGSSGSPVFNDDWKVVAIHHAGGELVANARGDKVFANQGILMASVCARFPVLTRSP
jgi:V8-like Glu-specific endopeptidase